MSDRRFKITKAQRAEIIRLYAEGELTQRDLAETYNVSVNTIGKVIARAKFEAKQLESFTKSEGGNL